MIELITGNTYGIAHGLFSPCCHYSLTIHRDSDRNAILNALDEWNSDGSGRKWYLVRRNDDGDWERLEDKPDKSRFELFSED